MLESETVYCPYCGETFEALLDLSGGDQQYYEDCVVCCRPILFDLRVHADEWSLETRRDDA